MQLKKTLLSSLLLASSTLWAQAPVEDINDPNRQRLSGSGIEAEIYQQLQQLREEVMSLRGTVEEQGHQLRQLKQQGLDRYIDIDRRLSALSGTAATPASGQATAAAATATTVGAESVPAEVVSAAAGAAEPVGQASDELTGKPSVDYANAYGLVKSRQYEAAIDAFKAYVAAYPQDRYVANAWYWLGELYVAITPQDLAASVQAFQTLLANYPDNGKVPAAMYKLGTVYFLQDDKVKAKELLTHVIDRYGNTGNAAVKKAREFLRNNY